MAVVTSTGQSTWAYRGCVIEQRWKDPRPGYRAQPDTFVWWHEDYDGAPMETGGPPGDNRCGAAQTLAEAIEDIDETLDEGEA